MQAVPPPPAAWLGTEYPPYRPTLDFPGAFVDAAHAAIAAWPCDGALLRGPVPGYLRPADALLLYELAALVPGDVLELGSYLGLSTTLLCQALFRAGRDGVVVSIENEPAHQRATAAAVAAAGLEARHQPLAGDAGRRLPELVAAGRRFGLAFVDHDHGYSATRAVCGQLARLLDGGAFAVFHDFNDPRNLAEPAAYGVYRAVVEALADPRLEFLGVIGCCGLVRRVSP